MPFSGVSGGIEFEAWYEIHAEHLVATLAAAVGNEDDARDAIGDACAKAYAQWGRVGAMANPAGWVYISALRSIRRSRTRRTREPAAASLAVAAGPDEVDPVVWRAVQQLPDRMRLAVALRYIGDLDEAEIARAMSITRGGVAALLHKARASLRTILDTEVSADDH